MTANTYHSILWISEDMKGPSTTTKTLTLLLLLLAVVAYTNAVHGGNKKVLSVTNSTLEHLLCNSTLQRANMTITLLPNVVYTISQNRFCVVENLTKLIIQGQNETNLPIIRCKPDNTTVTLSSGFGFVNITGGVVIENVRVENCGGVITPAALRGINGSYFYFGFRQSAVFVFNHCFGLQLRAVSIENYTGYAIVGVNVFSQSKHDPVQIHDVAICNSSYYDKLIPTTDYDYVGSGMLFYYLDPVDEHALYRHPNSTTLAISTCRFYWNWNHFATAAVASVVYALTDQNLKRLALNGGGAISIIYAQNRTAVTANIMDSKFVFCGGDLYGTIFVLFLSTPFSGVVHINECTFEGGFSFADKYSGTDLAVYYKFSNLTDTTVSETECLQVGHTHFHVGHKSYIRIHAHVALIQLSDTPATCDVLINDTRFTGGSSESIMVLYGCLYAFVLGTTNNLNIKLVDVSSNVSHGAFQFVNLGKVVMVGTAKDRSVFEGSTTSLIDVYSSDLHLRGYITFRNNQAQYGSGGGAILLEADSHLYFEEKSELVFENNHATYGGAIYGVESNSPFCMFQYVTNTSVSCTVSRNCSRDLDINVTFTGNTAELAGNSIYTDPLYSCDLILTSNLTVDREYLPKFYDKIFHFKGSSSNSLREMSSTASQVCFCENLQNGSTSHQCNQNGIFVLNETAFPGKNFSVRLIPLDSNSDPVYSIVSSALSRCQSNVSPFTEWELSTSGSISELFPTECSNVTYTIFSKHQVTAAANVCIVVQPVKTRTIGPRKTSSVIFSIVVKPCPLGFTSDLHGGCICSGLLTKHKSTCYPNSGLVRVPVSSWVGPVNHKDGKIGFSSACPNEHCKADPKEVNVSNDAALCAHKRTGVLCGKCPKNLSVIFGSAECKTCNNVWLLTIILYAFAGICLVILLFVLRPTVADGIVNGLVFYANVLSTNILIFLDHKSLHWLLTFVSLINLDLGFPICFYNGMDEIAKSYMQFVFPVYLWAITGVVIALSRYSVTISKLCSSYSVPVLATLLFLSYSKLLRAAIAGLTSADLEVESINGSMGKMTVWYFDGSIEYSTGRHIGLFILSFVTVVFFVVPYTVGVTGAPYLMRFKVVNYFKPMIDAYSGPYKDNHRFWFGARLCILIVILSAYAILKGRNDSLLLFIEAMILGICVYMQALINPYKYKLVYCIDTFFLINCFLLTSYGTYLHTSNKTTALYIGAGLLVGLAFLVFWLIVAYYIVIRLPRGRVPMPRRETFTSFLSEDSTSTYTGYQTIPGSNRFDSSDKLREPLLEDY